MKGEEYRQPNTITNHRLGEFRHPIDEVLRLSEEYLWGSLSSLRCELLSDPSILFCQALFHLPVYLFTFLSQTSPNTALAKLLSPPIHAA